MISLASITLALFAAAATQAKPLESRNNGGGGYNIAGYDTSRAGPSNANCKRQTYQISVDPTISVFTNVDSNASEQELTTRLFEFVTSLPAASNFTDQYLNGGKKQISKTFDISGIYCTPKNGAKDSSLVQLLVHGIGMFVCALAVEFFFNFKTGFDSSYWDFEGNGVPENYSYTYQAAKVSNIHDFMIGCIFKSLSTGWLQHFPLRQTRHGPF